MFLFFFPNIVEENRRWRIWRNLRRTGLAYSGKCGTEGRISSAAKASAENGGSCVEEAAR